MAAGLQPDRAVIVEPEPDGVSALGEIEGFDRMTDVARYPPVQDRPTSRRCQRPFRLATETKDDGADPGREDGAIRGRSTVVDHRPRGESLWSC